MDYTNTAKEILEKVGGKSNVSSVTHCMTRLRLTLKDESIVSDDEIKSIKGVVGLMKKGGQYQIVIGNEVAKCYKEVLKQGGFSEESTGTGPAPSAPKGGNIAAGSATPFWTPFPAPCPRSSPPSSARA